MASFPWKLVAGSSRLHARMTHSHAVNAIGIPNHAKSKCNGAESLYSVFAENGGMEYLCA